MFGLVKSSIRLRPFRYGRAVSKANARLDRRVSPKPPTQLVGGARVGSEARHSSERTSTRLLKAIVAASRPYHHLVVLLYCAFLLICLWLSASRAGFDTHRLWRWPFLFFGHRVEGVIGFAKTFESGECAGRNAQPHGALLRAPPNPAWRRGGPPNWGRGR